MTSDALAIAMEAVKIYAESRPRPSWVNQKQACEMLGVSHPTVRKMIREGKIKTNALGMIPTAEIDRVLAA